MFRTLSLAALALAAAGPAQSFTSTPAGFETTPGPAAGVRPFFGSGYRWQVVDHSLAGAPIANIVALAFRRDEAAAAASGAVARTADVTVLMGHGDIRLFHTVWADNYVAAPTTAHSTKPLNLPDLTVQTAGGAAEPWSIRIPLDAAFAYGGSGDLVYEIVYDNPSASTSFFLDRAPPTPSTAQFAFGTSIGTGCTVAGAGGPFTLTTIAYSHDGGLLARLGYELRHGPPAQEVVLNIDLVQSAIAPPGLCGALYVAPAIIATLGTTDAGGALGRGHVNFPFDPALTSTHVFVQALALDPAAAGFPIALSQAADLLWPHPGTPASAYAFCYSADPGSREGIGPVTIVGPVIAGLEQ